MDQMSHDWGLGRFITALCSQPWTYQWLCLAPRLLPPPGPDCSRPFPHLGEEGIWAARLGRLGEDLGAPWSNGAGRLLANVVMVAWTAWSVHLFANLDDNLEETTTLRDVFGALQHSVKRAWR